APLRQIVSEQIAGYFPLTAEAVAARLAGESRVVKVTHTKGPASAGIIHLRCEESGITTQNKRFASCPHQASPEKVVNSLPKPEAGAAQVVHGAEVHSPAPAGTGGQNQRVIPQTRDYRPCRVLQNGSGGRAQRSGGIGMEGVHKAVVRVVP